ncbi:hypothetical protein [Kineococcus esterisolvens]|uniref:hypothetical protein n=1 Tax=unclassified Kineococcus TaxID=2621656 RepID=UPI003D7DBD19
MILLWFGAWMNGTSTYAPAWVAGDWDRHPRCIMEDGTVSATLSPFGGSDLDLAAFRRLMEFVEDYGRDERTVLMVQVENEVGLLEFSRDHSAAAATLFASELPSDLRGALAERPGFEAARTWADVGADPLVRGRGLHGLGLRLSRGAGRRGRSYRLVPALLRQRLARWGRRSRPARF